MNKNEIIDQIVRSTLKGQKQSGIELKESTIKKYIADISDQSARCFLCKEESASLGVFAPNKPQEFGAASNKGRIFFYGLCSSCMNIDNVQDVVSDKIESNLNSII